MYVRDHVQNKWEELADELGLDDDEEVSKKLESLKGKWASDNRKATFEVLKLWLNYYKKRATWEALLDAISRLQLSDAVDSIKKYLSGRCTDISSCFEHISLKMISGRCGRKENAIHAHGN